MDLPEKITKNTLQFTNLLATDFVEKHFSFDVYKKHYYLDVGPIVIVAWTAPNWVSWNICLMKSFCLNKFDSSYYEQQFKGWFSGEVEFETEQGRILSLNFDN